MKKKRAGTTSIINKRARFEYEVLDTYEAGIVLSGSEVKSARLGRVQLKEAYAHVSEDENVSLLNAHFSKYPFSNEPDYDPVRSRRLLLKRSEIVKLVGILKQKGLSLVPLKMYLSRNRFKVQLGLVRGKKQFEKREKIKQRDLKRELKREFKDSFRD